MNHEDIKTAVHAALDERDGINREQHHADHAWVMLKRDFEQKREARRTVVVDRVKATVIGAITLGVLSVVGGALYQVGKVVIDIYQQTKIGGHGP